MVKVIGRHTASALRTDLAVLVADGSIRHGGTESGRPRHRPVRNSARSTRSGDPGAGSVPRAAMATSRCIRRSAWSARWFPDVQTRTGRSNASIEAVEMFDDFDVRAASTPHRASRYISDPCMRRMRSRCFGGSRSSLDGIRPDRAPAGYVHADDLGELMIGRRRRRACLHRTRDRGPATRRRSSRLEPVTRMGRTDPWQQCPVSGMEEAPTLILTTVISASPLSPSSRVPLRPIYPHRQPMPWTPRQSSRPVRAHTDVGRRRDGEVWLATDSRLARKVAIKLLPTAVTTVRRGSFDSSRRRAPRIHSSIPRLPIHALEQTAVSTSSSWSTSRGRPFERAWKTAGCHCEKCSTSGSRSRRR